MNGIIDRFEGDYAVIELSSGEMMNALKKKLPIEAQEGDAVIIEEDKITIDSNKTNNRKIKTGKLINDLFK